MSNKIAIAAEDAVKLVKNLLPFLEAAIPAVAAAGGPVGLGVSAAAALVPLLEQIPTGELVSVDEQQAQFNTVTSIVDGTAFDSPDWHPATQQAAGTPTATAPVAEAEAPKPDGEEPPATGEGNPA